MNLFALLTQIDACYNASVNASAAAQAGVTCDTAIVSPAPATDLTCWHCGKPFTRPAMSVPYHPTICCSVACESARDRAECFECGLPITEPYYSRMNGICRHLRCRPEEWDE